MKGNYLDVIRWEQADHSIMLTLVPVLVYLATHEYYVTATEIQFPARLADKVVKRPCHEPRFRCLLLGSASVAQVIHEIVVTVQRDRRFLRWAAIIKRKEKKKANKNVRRDLARNELSWKIILIVSWY